MGRARRGDTKTGPDRSVDNNGALIKNLSPAASRAQYFIKISRVSSCVNITAKNSIFVEGIFVESSIFNWNNVVRF